MDLFFTLALHQELVNAAALIQQAQRELTRNIDDAAAKPQSKPLASGGAYRVNSVKASAKLEMLCQGLEDSVQQIRAHVERWALWQREQEKAAQDAAEDAAAADMVDTDPTMDT